MYTTQGELICNNTNTNTNANTLTKQKQSSVTHEAFGPKKLPRKSPCKSNSNCVQNNCYNGKCIDQKDPGYPCKKKGDCFSNNCGNNGRCK
jgi:hypothetical protein